MNTCSRFWWTIIIFLFLVSCTPQTTPESNEMDPALPDLNETTEPAPLELILTPIEEATEPPALELVPTPSDETAAPTDLPSVPDTTSENEIVEEAVVEDSGETAVSFHRAGGFAGLDEQWLIYANGRVKAPDGSEQQVDVEAVQALLETITVNDFFGLEDSYIPEETCCDRITYEITVQMDGNVKTVQTIDGAEQPEQLTQVLSAVNNLLFASE